MKKIFILGLLLAPIVAHATGPAQDESDNPVIADDNPYYVTAEILPGDNTTVVSASYVKGAYNDTIAAVNLVWQGFNELTTQVDTIETEMSGDFNNLITNLNNKRVNALATWDSNNVTQLELSSLPAQP